MSIEKRRYIRFSLDVPAYRYTKDGEQIEMLIKQISIGGCLAGWNDSIFAGEKIRFEFTLPNKNRLPVLGEAIYRYPNKGIGIKFHEITQFEQELLGTIISANLEGEGLPVTVDPFTQPPKFVEGNSSRKKQVPEGKLKKDKKMEECSGN